MAGLNMPTHHTNIKLCETEWEWQKKNVPIFKEKRALES